jgi:Fe-S cluster assembly protein SufD
MTTQTTQEARAAFLDDFKRLEKGLTGYDRPWLAQIRRDAIERFSALGFPGAKDEAWKYTSVGPLVRERLQPVTKHTARDEVTARTVLASVAGIDARDPVAVFVDGGFVAAASRGVGDRDGILVESLAERLRRDGEPLAEHLAKVGRSVRSGIRRAQYCVRHRRRGDQSEARRRRDAARCTSCSTRPAATSRT